MNASLERGCAVLLAALCLASCGGGGSSAALAPSLGLIALSPLKVSLVASGTQQLSVTGTFSDGTTQALAAAGETFTSSDTAVATVSTDGLVTVPAGAAEGATATISATDTASGKTTAAADSTLVTVIAPVGPTAGSSTAAIATAQHNALCSAITPFYWEIGDKTATLASGSVGTQVSGGAVVASTAFEIASASKWIYAMYVLQVRGSAAALTAQDIPFMNFTSGYTNMGSDTTTSQCPSTDSPDTVNVCLTLSGSISPTQGQPYNYRDPATIGMFDYDSGHFENHASQLGGLGDVSVDALGPMVAAKLGSNINLVYSEPLIAGGIHTTAADYAQILRNVLSGSLVMLDALGTHAVCTLPASCPTAVFSPVPEAWHYSIGHWVEDDPATNSDGAFSSPGAFGFYPWIDKNKTFYGMISREDHTNGSSSGLCGRLVRQAWASGVEQTGNAPTN